MQNNTNQIDDSETDELPSGGTLLYGQYTIERHLLDGGFGMTYLARDSLERRVVIKECFPSTICRRINGEVRPRKPAYQEQFQGVIRNFLREALRLAKFEHPNIVKVHQVFQENNTAYFAMDFVDGMDLLTMMDMDPGRLTDELLESLLRDTLYALDHVHSYGMLHRDISPDNLLLDANNKLTLIDFGAAREDARRKTRVLSALLAVKDGYSPHEFYYSDTEQEPASDLYSVGATFYHVITGRAPFDCQKRLLTLSSGEPDPYKPLVEGNWGFCAGFLAAIDKALSVSQKDRFQSVGEWLDALEGVSALSAAGLQAAPQNSGVNDVVDPDAPARELEPDLVQAISSLVQDTNSRLESVQAKESEGGAAQSADEEAEEPPVRLVDLFGSPVDDVDAWLAEQDKETKHDTSGHQHASGGQTKSWSGPNTKASEAFAQGGQTSVGSALARAIGSFVGRKRNPEELIET
ncbi:serine/threonine protein kinase [Rhodobacteraceae bacterium D3-12]|nr:serine/threonine protein kinase [Rhodobacteraceae bacterium D3-12]